MEIVRAEAKHFLSIVSDAFDIFPEELTPVMEFASSKIKSALSKR
jgi:hypothetical protein